jgi:hypothetical protein
MQRVEAKMRMTEVLQPKVTKNPKNPDKFWQYELLSRRPNWGFKQHFKQKFFCGGHFAYFMISHNISWKFIWSYL